MPDLWIANGKGKENAIQGLIQHSSILSRIDELPRNVRERRRDLQEVYFPDTPSEVDLAGKQERRDQENEFASGHFFTSEYRTAPLKGIRRRYER